MGAGNVGTNIAIMWGKYEKSGRNVKSYKSRRCECRMAVTSQVFIAQTDSIFSPNAHTPTLTGKKTFFFFFLLGAAVLRYPMPDDLPTALPRCKIDRWPGIHSCQSQARAFLLLSPPTCLILSVCLSV